MYSGRCAIDVEILHERLSAAEGAILKTDSRLDALESSDVLDDHSAAHVVHDERLTALEETLAGCIAKLEQIESQIASTEQTLAIAEAVEATAQAEEAKAEAIIAAVEAEQESLEPEPMEAEVQEIEPEPEVEAPAQKEERKGNWLEHLFVLS